MKKFLFAAMILMLVLPCAFATENEGFVFRNGIRFGMTLEEVQALAEATLPEPKEDYTYVYEPGEDESPDYQLVYSVSMDSDNDSTGYLFTKTDDVTSLQEIGYILSDVQSASGVTSKYEKNTASHEQDYQAIEDTLTEKYGAPIVSELIISPYLTSVISDNQAEILKENTYRIVPNGDAIVVVGHFMMNFGAMPGNYISYFPMTEDTFSYQLNQQQVQDFLNNQL